ADFTRGRIYRIAPLGNKPSVPKVDLESKEGLLAALASPNRAVCCLAMGELHRMKQEEALGVLGPATRQKENVWLRARALWQMGSLHASGSSYWLGDLYEDNDQRFRQLVIRLQEDCFNITPDAFISHANLHWRDDVVNDTSAAVRREALLAL